MRSGERQIGLAASDEQLRTPLARVWLLGKRFQKFILVGALGLAVNQGCLFVFREKLDLALHFASPFAIFLSMLVTFTLNELWTWRDRSAGPLIHRVGLYFPINMVGLLINYLILQLLVDQTRLHYLIANLVGAGVAAVWNFLVNNSVTWRDRRVGDRPTG